MIIQKTVAVIRSFKNNPLEARVKKLREFIPTVIVVTDAVKDYDMTRVQIEKLDDINVHLIEMKNYSWSNALNRAIGEIRHMNNTATAHIPFEFMFNVSVEALFEKSHLETMLAEFAAEEVGVVGTSFCGIQDGIEVSLGRSYNKPRNTGMVIRLSVFDLPKIGGFDTFGDTMGSMEDHDLSHRLEVFHGIKTRILDLRTRLVVGVNHDQAKKEAREMETLQAFAKRYSDPRWAEYLHSLEV